MAWKLVIMVLGVLNIQWLCKKKKKFLHFRAIHWHTFRWIPRCHNENRGSRWGWIGKTRRRKPHFSSWLMGTWDSLFHFLSFFCKYLKFSIVKYPVRSQAHGKVFWYFLRVQIKVNESKHETEWHPTKYIRPLWWRMYVEGFENKL